MKKTSKVVTLVLGLTAAFTLLCGNVFASSYFVGDNASKIGIRIDVLNAEFYLNSVSEENKLVNNRDGTWSTGQITANYDETFQIVDAEGSNVGSSYTTTTEGKYVFTFTHINETLDVDVVSKFVYFNFLPMANGNQAGRVWNQFYCYAWNDADNSIKNADYPGNEMTAVNANGLYKTEIPGSADKVLFNNNGDQDDHMIKTADLDYDIAEPMFACTSKADLTTCEADDSPLINDSSDFTYYLHTSHNSWADMDKAYGFEQTEDSSQFLLRCYFSNGDKFVIRDTASHWWNQSCLGTDKGEWLSNDGDDILINASDFYNIYFKPDTGKIYITKG